jgi:hypothetical protein
MSRMPIRYVSQNEIIALLRASPASLAKRAGASLDPADVELVPVSSGTLDLRSYEVRLARAEAGQGPRVAGLAAFVEALKRPTTGAESLSVAGSDGTQFIMLLDGGQVVAITAIEVP